MGWLVPVAHVITVRRGESREKAKDKTAGRGEEEQSQKGTRKDRTTMMRLMCLAPVVPLVALGLLLLILMPMDAVAFVPCSAPLSKSQNRPTQGVVLYADSWDSSSADGPAAGGGAGAIEQIEFKIYPDGRVEETVRGVKGNNCHKVTEKINEALGKGERMKLGLLLSFRIRTALTF